MGLLYKTEYAINEKITLVVPYVGDVLKNEDKYYSQVAAITSMPIDMMAQLDEVGIDFTSIDEYELFLILFHTVAESDVGILFKNIDLSKFHYAEDERTKSYVLVDPENDIVIDRKIHGQIASVLRKIHNLEKNTKRPGNESAKTYLLEREKKRLKKNKGKPFESQLEPLIVSMVNTQQFKYNYQDTKCLTIYQFNESVKQIIKKVDYDNRMVGIYTGNINTKELKPEDLTWLNSTS